MMKKVLLFLESILFFIFLNLMSTSKKINIKLRAKNKFCQPNFKNCNFSLTQIANFEKNDQIFIVKPPIFGIFTIKIT